jgi:putative flippase GtrA
LERLIIYTRTDRKELERFLKFMVVGIVGAAVDFGTYNLLNEAFSLPPEVSGTISLIMAICSNFAWNRYWTYPDSRSKPIVRQFIQFFIVNVLGVLIRVPIIALTRDPFAKLAESLFSFNVATAQTIGNNMALAVAVVIVMFWNFFVNRFWTYSDVGGWGQAPASAVADESTSVGSAAARESN